MVVSASDDGAEKATEPKKRRIELSLRPQDANSGISTNELIAHSTVMASVVSVEDHGIIMDLGLSNLGVRGFLSSKETDLAIRNSALKEGDVVLCMITGLSSNGKIIKLSANMPSFANTKKFNYLVEGPTVDAFLPGTAVELLVTDVTRRGVVGKVMGMIDVTADVVHSRVDSGLSDISKKYQIGSKVKARIIYKHPAVETHKLGVSFLDNLMALSIQTTLKDKTPQDPLDVLPLSSVIEAVTVKRVEPGVGLFVDVGLKGIPGFVHISRIAEKKIETLDETTGPYKVGSTHRARVIGYNSVDGLYLLSTEPRVLEQAFLRIEDLKIGEVVKGTVEKLVVNASGVGGVLVTLADGITGLVPEMHMSDVALLHPEKRFKAGMKVTARVVSTDPGKRKIRLTLKKSLVNSEAAPIRSYAEITLGAQSPGTIVNILPSGAVVQFYGTIRGFLPVSEMSEAYIQDPKQHFRVGQVVNVRVIGVDASAERMTVSCKDPAALTLEQKAAFKATNIGDVVSAVVTEKSTDGVRVELPLSSLRGVLHIGHLSDSSDVKNAAALKKLRVGQTLQDLVVLEKVEQNYSVVLTHKPSIIQAVREQTFPRDFSEVAEGKLVYGFVKRTTDSAVILQFGGRLTGLIPNTHLPKEALSLPDFGFKRHDSVAARVLAVDAAQQRFLLTLKSDTSSTDARRSETAVHHDMPVSSPIDSAIKSMNDFSLGRVTKARIISVKETQINVQLADGVQGRIDVSQVFDSWDEIKDRKHPLRSFAPKQVISVRILGIHDARNHRFLAITHRTGKTPVFELSAKPSDQGKEESGALSLDKIEVGSTFIAFVNNILDDCLWVNLSPGVRGRITALDITDDVSLLKDIEANFPIGSAIRVRVTGVDISNNKLDLSARIGQTGEALTFRNLNRGTVVPGKVTRVTDRQVMVQLSENVSGPVNLPDLADDFAQANPMAHARNDIVRVCVVEVDPPNKRIRLSMRPSRTLNSALPVVDPELISIDQLKVNDVVRGFVKNVADNGIFVNFGGSVTGYVRISDLSDSYIKDWKSAYQVDQLVKGKVIAVDKARNQVQLSLKSSVLDANYVAPLTFNDLTVGQVVTGKVRKVEEFGVFVVIDGSSNLSGLCHKSEMADGKVESAKKLYEEGDVVQAKILKLDPERKRISFGLKASYFDSELGDDDDSEDDTSDEMQGVLLDPESDSNDDEMNDDSEQAAVVSADAATKSATELSVGAAPSGAEDGVAALNAGGFDWTGNMLDDAAEDVAGASVDASNVATKKKHRKAAIQVDRTGDLDTDGPQTLADFERLLLGQHNSSQLWIEYMAYHVKLSELVKAREIGERALRTIDIREESEKMNIWTAMLNIENEFGTKETLEEVFLRACQYNDPQEISERLATIYIQSGKHEVSAPVEVYVMSTNILAERGRTVPGICQEILPISISLVQLRPFPPQHLCITRTSASIITPCYSKSANACTYRTHSQICGSGVPFSEWFAGTGAHYIRRGVIHLP